MTSDTAEQRAYELSSARDRLLPIPPWPRRVPAPHHPPNLLLSTQASGVERKDGHLHPPHLFALVPALRTDS